MRILLGILGFGLVVLAGVDVLWTTVLLEAGGPVSSRLAPALWRLMLWRHRSGGSRRHKLLSYAGLLIIVATLALWLGLLWLGWTLIFNMTEGAVVGNMSLHPASFWTRLAFVGGNLTTMGPGSYRAGSPVWHVLSAVSSASGFFLVTLAAAYLLPLVAAVVEQRQLAGYITALGRRPEDLLLHAWNGSDFGSLGDHLRALVPSLSLLGQRHLAYPILHYFHSIERETAIAPSVAALDEALTLLEYGVDPEVRPDLAAVRPLRWAIGLFLHTLEEEFLAGSDEAPPLPALDELRDAGIRTASPETFAGAAAALTERRKLLLGFVEHSGWHWRNVASQPE